MKGALSKSHNLDTSINKAADTFNEIFSSLKNNTEFTLIIITNRIYYYSTFPYQYGIMIPLYITQVFINMISFEIVVIEFKQHIFCIANKEILLVLC